MFLSARSRFVSSLRGFSHWVEVFALLVLMGSMQMAAQTGGEGAIGGTVTDTTGAAVPGAVVTAVNVDTGVATTRPTSSGGVYNIAPLIPGTYTVTVTAKGFGSYKQEKITVNALNTLGLNVALKVGSEAAEVTVTDAPPSLDTTNATLGGTIDSSEYMDLPLLVSGNQQRDITQFSNLLPGAQLNPGGRSSIVGGTAQRVGEVYLDGLPLTTISQQGDNRPILNVVPLEAIGQLQVVTSGFSAEYEGAGLENYNLKSGTNGYHGTVADFLRNTAFDTWGFSAPWTRVVNGTCLSPSPCYAYNTPNSLGHISKPADHQNEFTFSVGGPISIPHFYNGRDKLFLHFTLDKLGSLSAPAYAFYTIPTTLMQQGNFCELLTTTAGGCGTSTAPGFQLYNPTTLTCPTATTCQRTAIAGNMIPSAQISPISKYLQQFLPAPTNGNLTSNYLGGTAIGYQNFLYATRIDYALSDRQRISAAWSNGRRHAVPYTSGNGIPVPYLPSTLSTVVGNFFDAEYSFTISPHLVNQLNAGYIYFGGPPVRNSTEGIAKYEATTAGITGLPAGQGSDEFPGVTFGGTDGGTAWSQPDVTSKTVSHTFDLVDNVNWVIGKHSLYIGIQLQDLMENASTANSFSTPITYAYSNNDTSQLLYTAKSSSYSYNTATSGFPYASYLLGAVDSTGVTLQPFSDVGSRYHTAAPYVQDDYKVTSKLTLNLGLRWDYLPGFREVLDRWSFLNATATNPYTGTPGSLQFAGNYGGAGVSCGCTTPVHTYWKDFGPRVGFAYSADPKTVFRGSFAILYSHGGGTGGASATGTGQTGFNDPVTFSANPAGANAGPVFYLNNSGAAPAFNNANFGGPGYSLPSIPAISASTQLSTAQVGNFVNSAGAFVKSNNGIAYADPYYGDRTPTFYFYNFGFERSLTQAITFSANYAGSISHFLAGAGGLRGVQSNEINPAYLPLGTLLNANATAANIAAAQAILPGCCTAPYAGFTAAAGTAAGNGIATIGQGLKWMPQYSGVTDTWGLYSANAAYNAMQMSVAVRPTHGLTLNVNYTWSKEIDDAGTIRTGFAIPGSANATGKSFAADRMDRSLSTIDSPHNLAAYGVYKLPFGKGHIGGDHFLVRALAGGWEFSSIVTYAAGYPLTLSSSSCTSSTLPGQGTCMPDANPAFTGSPMVSSWKQGVTALTLGTKSFIKEGLYGTAGYNASTTPGSGGQYTQTVMGVTSTVQVPCAQSGAPFCNPNSFQIGDATRTGAFGLHTPGNFRLTSGLRRSFDITQQVKFIFGVDCQNVTNSVTFGENAGNLSIPTGINTSSYGTLNFASSDSRDFQFSGRVSF